METTEKSKICKITEPPIKSKTCIITEKPISKVEKSVKLQKKSKNLNN